MARSLEYLDRATELAPDTLRYLDIAAHANSVVGNDEKAIELWTARLERGPPYGESHFNLAHTYQPRMGKSGRALHHWEKARQLLPHSPDVVLFAARFLAGMGRKSEAIDWLQGFLQRHPTHDRYQEARDATTRLADSANSPGTRSP
jgi:tetratricopeptide (TPR) repeat protein